MPEFFREGKRRYPDSAEFKFTYEIGPNETLWVCDNIWQTARNFDTIIMLVYNDRTAQIANKVKEAGKKVIIFSIMSPTKAINFQWADTILIGYSYSDFSIQALFGALAGDFKPAGVLPFER